MQPGSDLRTNPATAVSGAPQVASRAAIAAHYDLSTAFYRLWLDPTLSYSCALWPEGNAHADLETAQLCKLDYHLDQAKVAVGARQRLLDVGCGWGALLDRAVTERGIASGVGLTLSEEQAQTTRERRLPGVEVRLESWVDHVPSEPYDAVVSIGAFEHFARPGMSAEARHESYAAFFEKAYAWTKPGSHLSLQTIAYGTLKRGGILPFMSDEIFPESDLPLLSEILAAAEPRYEILRVRNDRTDYERTCLAWSKALKARREEAHLLVGERRVELFEQYLQQSRFGFAVGATQLLRLTFARRR